jgi:hypothetical protein
VPAQLRRNECVDFLLEAASPLRKFLTASDSHSRCGHRCRQKCPILARDAATACARGARTGGSGSHAANASGAIVVPRK